MDALTRFEAAGHQCLRELSDQTLSYMETVVASRDASSSIVDKGARTMVLSEAKVTETAGLEQGMADNSSLNKTNETQRCACEEPDEAKDGGSGFDQAMVYRMFEEFDTDGDGLLGLEEFEEILVRLGVGEICGAEELPMLAKTFWKICCKA